MSPLELEKINQIPLAQSAPGPSLFVDLLIGVGIFAGYWFITSKQYSKSGIRALWIIIAYAFLLGFLTPISGFIAKMWIWIGTAGGMAIGWWSNRRNGQS